MQADTVLYTLASPVDLERLRALLPAGELDFEVGAAGGLSLHFREGPRAFTVSVTSQNLVPAALERACHLVEARSLGSARRDALLDFFEAAAAELIVRSENAGSEAMAEAARGKLGAALGGVWLRGNELIDVEGRTILGEDGSEDPLAKIPMPHPERRRLASWVRALLRREAEVLELNESEPSADSLGTPLDQAYDRVRLGVERAGEYGLEEDEDIFTFLSMMFEVGPNFDDQPELRAILSDRGRSATERLQAALDHPEAERLWEETEALADPALWTIDRRMLALMRRFAGEWEREGTQLFVPRSAMNDFLAHLEREGTRPEELLGHRRGSAGFEPVEDELFGLGEADPFAQAQTHLREKVRATHFSLRLRLPD